MKRKIMAGLLSAAVLVAALTACDAGAAATTAPAEDAAAAVEEAAEAVEEAAEEVAEVAEAASEEWEGDVDEINILFFDLRGVGENSKEVLDAMNEITAKKAGVKIAQARFGAVAEYGNAVSLALSSGE